MATRRLKAVAAFVVAMGALQIFVEDVLVFLGTTGGAPGVLQSRVVMMAIPLAIATLLFVVLVGGALLSADSLR